MLGPGETAQVDVRNTWQLDYWGEPCAKAGLWPSAGCVVTFTTPSIIISTTREASLRPRGLTTLRILHYVLPDTRKQKC